MCFPVHEDILPSSTVLSTGQKCPLWHLLGTGSCPSEGPHSGQVVLKSQALQEAKVPKGDSKMACEVGAEDRTGVAVAL
jgi:hypothetical protein